MRRSNLFQCPFCSERNSLGKPGEIGRLNDNDTLYGVQCAQCRNALRVYNNGNNSMSWSVDITYHDENIINKIRQESAVALYLLHLPENMRNVSNYEIITAALQEDKNQGLATVCLTAPELIPLLDLKAYADYRLTLPEKVFMFSSSMDYCCPAGEDILNSLANLTETRKKVSTYRTFDDSFINLPVVKNKENDSSNKAYFIHI